MDNSEALSELPILTLGEQINEKEPMSSDSFHLLHQILPPVRDAVSADDYEAIMVSLANVGIEDQLLDNFRNGNFDIDENFSFDTAARLKEEWIDPIIALYASAQSHSYRTPMSIKDERLKRATVTPYETTSWHYEAEQGGLSAGSGDEQEDEQVDQHSSMSMDSESESDSAFSSAEPGAVHHQEEPAVEYDAVIKYEDLVDEKPSRSRPGTMQWDEAEQLIQEQSGEEKSIEEQESSDSVGSPPRPLGETPQRVRRDRPRAGQAQITVRVVVNDRETETLSQSRLQYLIQELRNVGLDINKLPPSEGDYRATYESEEGGKRLLKILVPPAYERSEWDEAREQVTLLGYDVPYARYENGIIFGRSNPKNFVPYEVFKALGISGTITKSGRGRLLGTINIPEIWDERMESVVMAATGLTNPTKFKWLDRP